MLRLKILKYLVYENKDLFFKYFLKNPLVFTFKYVKSIFIKKRKIENLYLFELDSLEIFFNELKNKNTRIVLGFSYCQKSPDCFDRFSKNCDPNCNKCLISSFLSLPNVDILIIPTFRDLALNLLNIYEINKKILFIIIACDFSIDLFYNFANLFKIKGIAIPLEKKVCNNLQTFFLAEKGIKKAQTELSSENLKFIEQIKKFIQAHRS